ncbi:Nudix family hydrolase [Thiomicrospira sp. WB1]|uniref:Nudix family hydrolase n=1 Tax=Thiomicrospira sp. WB1 TaxID=1685380 RepID=UPI000748B6DF|nr:Nudix family hydrolase [Thiomicrospira sp. WB1]KUJ71411.1 hypothetical protein AVO41_07735 [Thiomicrospira sp. WB1]
MEETLIAVGVLRQGNQVLIAQRQTGQHLAHFWEFPGGKVKSGETPDTALTREFEEEVGVSPLDWQPLIEIPWQYERRRLRLIVRMSERFDGTPFGREGQAIKWCALDELMHYEFPAANQGVLNALALPDQMMITGAFEDREDGLTRLAAALEDGIRLVQLRSKKLDEAGFLAWAREALALCHEYEAQAVLNGPAGWLRALPEADGLQLSSHALMSLVQRPAETQGKWLGASVHSQAELAKAMEVGVDYVLLSPVKPTASHPDMSPLGWETFAEWVRDCPVPVFALGGVGANDVEKAKEHGGQGIAAISGLWPQPM